MEGDAIKATGADRLIDVCGKEMTPCAGRRFEAGCGAVMDLDAIRRPVRRRTVGLIH